MKDRNYWKERLPLIQAYVDGHEIESSLGVCTSSAPSIGFNGPMHIYKILPKPDPYKKFKDAKKAGKIIQIKNGNDTWIDEGLDGFAWTANPERYRIKPEPKLIPFTIDDAEQLIGKSVKEKTHGVFGIVTWVLHDCVEIGADPIAFSALLDWYTFLDGTPCGKYIECE